MMPCAHLWVYRRGLRLCKPHIHPNRRRPRRHGRTGPPRSLKRRRRCDTRESDWKPVSEAAPPTAADRAGTLTLQATARTMKKGVPVSPGIAVARAYCVDHGSARREPYHLESAAVAAEVQRFDEATAAAARDLDAIIAKVARQVGEDEAAIFRAHRLLLRDPSLGGKVKALIRDKQIDAASALELVVEEYEKLFASIADPYLRDRMADLRDVAARILAQLAIQSGRPALDVNEPVVLVAREILPSQALTFDRKYIAGILTEKGGATGHAP